MTSNQIEQDHICCALGAKQYESSKRKEKMVNESHKRWAGFLSIE